MTVTLDRLVDIPVNPAPPGARVDVLTAQDGVALRSAAWLPSGAKGTVAVFPGRSEFIEKYFETIGELMSRGFCVAALDWRGQGGSQRPLADRRKGHVDDFDLYLRDIDAFFVHLEAIGAPKPWFGLAHSMGGAILLLSSARGERRLARLALSAPMMGLFDATTNGLARYVIQIANLAGLGGRYVPGSGAHAPSGYAPFEGNLLTSDPVRYQRNAATMIAGPDVTIGAPTIGWLAAAFRLMSEMQSPDFGLSMSIPTLVVCAGADRIVSTPVSERLAGQCRGVETLTIPSARHEILMESDGIRAQFWAAFDAFIPGG